MVSTSSILIWIVVPILNFFIWFHIGNNKTIKCEKIISENAQNIDSKGIYIYICSYTGVCKCIHCVCIQ